MTPKKRTVVGSKSKRNNDNPVLVDENCKSPFKSPRKENAVRCASPLSDLTNAQCVQGVGIAAAKSTAAHGKPKSAKKLVMNQEKVVEENFENTEEHESAASGFLSFFPSFFPFLFL